MSQAGKSKTIIFAVYLLIVHLALIYLIYDKFRVKDSLDETNKNQPVIALPTPVQIPPEKIEPTVAPTATPIQMTKSQETNANNENLSVNIQSPTTSQNTGKLMIPVIGVKKSELTDTFNDARSENRVHNAIDIMSKGGTPVIAAADGEIAKFFDSKLGGTTIYQYSVDKKQIYYYAHLQRRADNLAEHDFVKQGTVIGYVGDTGNAGAGNYHLHFAISILDDPKKYWQGTEINPFPLLKDGIESK